MNDIERLNEILWEIKELINEAKELFDDTSAQGRFEGYPYAHIIGALDNDHYYLGGSFITFQECIDELQNREDEE